MQNFNLSIFLIFSLVCLVLTSNDPKHKISLGDSKFGKDFSNEKSNQVVEKRPTLKLSSGIVSWNLGEKLPKRKDLRFIKSFIGKDIICIGIQECENIKIRRKEGHRPRFLKKYLRDTFKKDYKCLSIHKLGGMQISLFIKKSLFSLVEGIQVNDVSCGVGNFLSNKGAVILVLRIKEKTIIFINCHLAAHQNKVLERNRDFERIKDSLQEDVQKDWRISRSVLRKLTNDGKKRKFSNKDFPFDGVFFFGDLNYRVDIPRSEIETFVEKYHSIIESNRSNNVQFLKYDLADKVWSKNIRKDVKKIVLFDQLKKEISMKRAFKGFNEGEILFPPTYKYDLGTNHLDSSDKKRCPAWTDRILFLNGISDSNVLDLKDYYSLLTTSSDHHPVAGEFEINL